MIADLVVQLAQMTLVLIVAPLLLGWVRTSRRACCDVAVHRHCNPIATCFASSARKLSLPTMHRVAVSRRALHHLRHYLGRGRPRADIRHRPAVQLVCRHDRDRGAPRYRAFSLALAGMDIGTSFGGIGVAGNDDRLVAEPAMIMVVFTLSLLAGSTQLSSVAAFMLDANVGLRVSLAPSIALIVAIAENARIPVDNPATHLELTMVHEAMVLEYSGRHLAMIEAAAALKLVLYVSLIVACFFPGAWPRRRRPHRLSRRDRCLFRQARRPRRPARAFRNGGRQDAGVPRARVSRDRADARPPRYAASVRQPGL